MKRIDTSTSVPDGNGPGKRGFRDGSLATSIMATAFNAAWANAVQEEIAGVIEGAGIALVAEDMAQLVAAVQRLASRGVRTITGPAAVALTPADAGLVLLDAAAGAISVTLPAANAAGMKGGRFEFRRIDVVRANAVAVTRASTNTVDESGTGFSLYGRGEHRSIMCDGVAGWRTVAVEGGQAWADYGASRASGVTYTNSTGRPITVNVTATLSVAGGNVALLVDGVIASIGSGNTWAGAPASSVSCIVPAGSTYSIGATSGPISAMSNWYELR